MINSITTISKYICFSFFLLILSVANAQTSVTGVSVNPTTVTITEGFTQQLTETVSPVDATDPSVTWSSDDNLIASVDGTGLVTAVAAGTATITVTTTDGSFTATSTITVEAAPIAVTGVILDLPTVTITEGFTQQLTETVSPVDATDPSVTWSSDDNLIASVDGTGLVTAVAAGTATITVTTTDGSFTATSTITVEAAPIAVTGVILDLPTVTITEGFTQQLTETVSPVDATDPSVTWSSDDNLIASVDGTGLVTAVAAGTATITVTTTDGSFTATSTITVEAAPIAVTGVILDLPTVTITEGFTQQLTETVSPVDATDPSVTWSSDDNLIASVDGTGLVTAVAAGTATITVTTTDGSFTATSTITVEAAPIAVTGVILDLPTVTITEGFTQQLTETVSPVDATDPSVTWSSDDNLIASVDGTGLVTAVAAGTATITVTTTDGSFTATSTITVEAAPIAVTGVILDLPTVTITEGFTQQLTETVSPVDATDPSVTWSSDDNLIASVDGTGLVTAVAAGTATITVTTTDGSFTATSTITVEAAPIAVTGVILDLPTVTITEGFTQQLTETVSPVDATDPSVTWSSDDNLIASVDGTGLVTAVAAGTATITVTTTDGSFTATSTITVEAAPIAVTGVILDLPTVTITEGFTQQLTETVSPVDATDPSVTWSSDDNLIASVDGTGLVTAVAAGTATITVTTTDGSFTATSTITVEAAPIAVTGVILDLPTVTITEGFTQQLTETVSPVDATDPSVTWSSDDNLIASVDGTGLVTAVAAGTVTITVTTTDGSFTATSTITVEAAPIAVTGVILDLPTVTITEGFTQQLTETVSPVDATDPSVTWSSDDNLIASVDGTGLVTAVAAGTATITVTTTDGSFTATSTITVEAAPIAVTGVILDLPTVTITEGFTQQLTETVSPVDATDPSVTWSSDDNLIASVDGTGLVTAVAAGTVTITVTTTDGSFTATSTITVEAAPIAVTGVSLDLPTVTITEGFTQQLTETVSPVDATDPSVTWSSDDNLIASVDGTGLVTAVAAGTATITVTTTDGSFTATSTITVEAAPIAVTGVSVNPTTVTITEGFTQQLTETVSPVDATDPSVTWSSDDNLIASVDGTGLVTAVAAGTATITVTTTDGSFTATSTITVEAAPIAVTGVSLDLPTVTITEGFTQQLTETVSPVDATDPSVTWSSDDNLIASVDGTGLVTAVAAGTVTITVTTTDGSFTATSTITVIPPYYQIGRWSDPIQFGIVPVAVANLPNGKLVTWSSKYKDYFGGADGFTYYEIFDPFLGPDGTAEGEKTSTTNHDMFCPGVNNLPNGQILVTGGSSNPKATLYDYTNDIWIPTDNMNIGRGYQGSVTLSDGSAMVIGGSWSGGLAPNGEKIAEIWRPETGWKTLTGLRSDVLFNQNDLNFETEGVYRADNHSWLWAAPNGKVFHAGPGEEMHWFDVTGSGSYTSAGNRADDTYSMKGTTVMFDIGKILKVGGATSYASGDLAKDNSYVIDINTENNVTVSPTSNNLSFSRTMHNSVVLPNGEVLVTGGLDKALVFSDAGARLTAELYNPSTNAWQSVAGMQIPRTYHSVAILQADGRVFTGGGGLCNSCANHLDAEIYSPPYLFNSDGTLAQRPTINAPATADYNSTISVTGSVGVQEFSLIRMSSSTHSTNNEQRRIPLTFSGNGTYTLNIPDRNILPPGYYMLFALDGNGVPSIASTVLVGVPTILVSGVTTNPEFLDLESGETGQLSAIIIPSNADNQVVSWSSSDPAVATVDSNGLVTAVSSGSVLVSVTTDDRDFTSRTNIIVDGGCTLSNVAIGATAIQSSTYGNGDASYAVDGNTSGSSPWSADLQHTTNEPTPWWEVDLGSEYVLEEIEIYNRTNGFQSRLQNFYVFVSNVPFSSIASLNDLINDPSISDYYFDGAAGLQETIELNANGRFLRIQLSGSGVLHMAEVEIMGCFSGSTLCEGVLPATITPAGPFVDSDSVQTLIGSPAGGVWSGESTDGTFDPTIGPGTYTVRYTYDNGAGCITTDTEYLVVKASCDGVPPISIGSFGPYVDTNPIQTLSANPTGGVWSGASTDGTFDPSVGPGTYSVTYTYDNEAGCIQTETIDISVISLNDCTLSNVALGGTASQSSTYGNGVAGIAIDGNTTGSSPWSADLQHTTNESSPWWELDLGADYDITDVVIFNRTDGLQYRLSNFYVFVSDIPFPPTSTLGDLIADEEIAQYHFPLVAGLQETMTFNTEGRYVRIQLSSSGILHMAEVEVMGCLSDPLPCDGEPAVSITPSGPYLDTDSVQTLSASPIGGVWSGASTDGTFDPGMGAGTYSVTYTHDNGAGCIQSDTIELVVNDSNCTLSNVALGGTASQSSTYGNGVAATAIDGNTTGSSPWSPDLQHTNYESTPWWELDLGADHNITDMVIFNRTDALQSRLNNFYVFVSDIPFPPSSTLGDLIADNAIDEYYFTGEAGLQETISLNTEGRYVRIQLSGNGTLHMAEVEVMGCLSGPPPCDGQPAVSITPSGPYLDTDSVQTLSASPIGGVWSGASTDGTFDPSMGAGTYSVTYTHDNGAGCIQSDTIEIVVNIAGCTLSNVALGGTASQSSTYGNGVAATAIDGNTTGSSPWSPDLQHTNYESTPWWELDLGADHNITDMVIFNRTDALQSRLNNFYVFVSDIPFPPSSTLGDLIADNAIDEYYFTGEAGLQETISLNTEGRYVRIQLSGNGTLHMAEVEVMGCLSGPPPCDGQPAVSITPSGPYLDTDSVQTLSASPIGGVWSGASTDGTFDPSMGAGTYSVTYTHDNGAGCIQSDTIEIVVNIAGCTLSNVALGGTASQSSTYGNGVAALAIDGNTSGSSPWSADLQHTTNESTPWWELDLGEDHNITDLIIYNRSNNFQSRLNNFYVFVSDIPFPSSATLGDLIANNAIDEYYFAGAAGLQETISLSTVGRYVRIQLSGNGTLHMAEVEVMGCPTNGSTSFRAYIAPEAFNADGFDFKLVPNPASKIVNIEFTGTGKLEKLIIYDVNGKQVLTKQAFITPTTTFSKDIDISHLADGIYQVYIKLEDGREFFQKLIKN